MTIDLERWAITERQFIKDDLKWLKAGSRLISPSGDDITRMKINQLEARLEDLQKILDGVEGKKPLNHP